MTGAMNSNKKQGGLLQKINQKIQKGSKEALKEREAFIEGMEKFEKQWQTEVVDRINSFEKVETSLKKFSKGEKDITELTFSDLLNQAKKMSKEGNTNAIDILTQNVEGYNKKTGEMDFSKSNTGVLESKSNSFLAYQKE